MSSPFDSWLATLPPNQKQAVDALVPGQVGAGPNPGTTGQMDSDPNEATNSNLGLQRFAQGAAPIMQNTNADGGLGYSNPPPATSPSMQMFADVKAAAVENEARAYAFEIYSEVKAANTQNGNLNNAPQAKEAAVADPIAYWAEMGRQYAAAGN